MFVCFYIAEGLVNSLESYKDLWTGQDITTHMTSASWHLVMSVVQKTGTWDDDTISVILCHLLMTRQPAVMTNLECGESET